MVAGPKTTGGADGRYDLTHTEVIHNPYPLFADMRREAPVHWNPSVKGWLLTRYGDTQKIMRDPRFSVEKMAPFAENVSGSAHGKISFLAEVIGGWMVFKDPPDHTRLRRVLQAAFMPKQLEKMRPKVEGIVNDLLDGLGDRTEMDFVGDFAFPFPATVIGDLCGVPRDRIGKLKFWGDNISKFVLQGRNTSDKYDRSYAALRECTLFYRDLVAAHRADPKPDLTTLMIEGGDSGDPMTDDEIVSTLVLLLFAGHETTTNLIANGMLALLHNPDQLRLLQDDHGLIPGAVEEFLRFEGPAATVVRIAKEDVEIAGHTIKRGDRVFASLSAAGRDPEVFDNPESVDVCRPKNRHMAFGMGIHLCLGAPLARLEGRIAFEALLTRYIDFRFLGDAPEWRDELITRGLVRLPLGFRHQA